MKEERHKKEIETKAFQDKQLQEKLKKKEEAKLLKMYDFEKINSDTLSFEEQEKKKREYIHEKNKKNLTYVK